MKVSVRSYLIAGLAMASTGIIAVTPVVLPVTPYGTGVAGAQPADDDSNNETDRPGADSGVEQNQESTGTPTRSSDEPTDDDDSSASAVAGQSNRGARSRISVVPGDGQTSTGDGQTSTDGRQVAVRLPSRVTADVDGDTPAPGVSNDVQSFGALRSRVTVAANGSIRPHTQVSTSRAVTRVSATAASAADSASAPSPGRTINAAVQRALAGQTSATAHASTSASGRATVRTETAPTGIRAAQPARSSSPYAGNR